MCMIGERIIYISYRNVVSQCLSVSSFFLLKKGYPPLIHRLSTRCYSAEIAEHITANRGARVLGKYAEGGTKIKKNDENYECIEKA